MLDKIVLNRQLVLWKKEIQICIHFVISMSKIQIHFFKSVELPKEYDLSYINVLYTK